MVDASAANLDTSSSMAATLERFSDQLPEQVVAARGYDLAHNTLRRLPQVFMNNGFGIEHDVGDGATPSRNTLSVSVATRLGRYGRLDLARFVDRHMRPWLHPGQFSEVFLSAISNIGNSQHGDVFPSRCYFGFEADDSTNSALRVAGVVWSYLEQGQQTNGQYFDTLYSQLLGERVADAAPSLARLRELCGDRQPVEIGFGARGDDVVYKSYLFQALGDSAELLREFEVPEAERLRRLIDEVAQRAPSWQGFCPIDVMGGRCVRLGFEFNLEQHRAERWPALRDARLLREMLPPSFAREIFEGLGRERITRTNALDQRCTFEVTHLKVSLDARGRTKWKAYFAFRSLDNYPERLPLLAPWTRFFTD